METETQAHNTVQVRALKVFGIVPDLIEPGTILLVSETRASYLCFLQLVERIV